MEELPQCLKERKIAFFLEGFARYYSGGRYHAWLYVHALTSLGADVTVFTNYKPHFYDDFKYLPGHDKIKIIEDRRWGQEYLRKNHERWDAVGACPWVGGDHALYFSRKYKVPLFLLIFETPNWTAEYDGQDKVDAYVQDLWKGYRIAMPKASLIVNSTKIGMEYNLKYVETDPGRHAVIAPPINSVLADRVIPGIPQDVKREGLIYISRFVGHKNYYQAIDIGAAAKVPVTMLGDSIDNDQKKAILKRAEEKKVKVILVNDADDVKKYEILARQRLMVFPTRFEGFGMPPAEALYCGTPCVTYNLPVLKETYKDSLDYARLGNREELIEKALRLLRDDKYWEERAAFGRKYIQGVASFDRFAREVGGAMLRILKGPKAKHSPFWLGEYIPSTTGPKISVVTPCLNTPVDLLKDAIESVFTQTHKNVEFCLVLDGQINEYDSFIRQCSKIFRNRFKHTKLPEHQGIALATRKGIELADGEVVVFLDADDRLTKDALATVAEAFDTRPNLKFAYSDERQIDKEGKHITATRKPNWSRELMYQCMYVNHLKAFRRSVFEGSPVPRKDFGRSQDYDMVLTLTHGMSRDEILHINQILYEWRVYSGISDEEGKYELDVEETGMHGGGLPATYEGLSAANAAFKADGGQGEILPLPVAGRFEIRRSVVGNPRVAIFLLTKDNPELLNTCLTHLKLNTAYPYDLKVMHHKKGDFYKTEELLKAFGCEVVPWEEQYNYSKMNNMLIRKYAKDYDYVLLLNDDIFVAPRWLTGLLGVATQDPKAGILGMKLIYPETKDPRMQRFPEHWMQQGYSIQHAGVDLCRDFGAMHKYHKFPANAICLNYVRQLPAVTFASVLISTKVFDNAMFDEQLKSDLNDIDLCVAAGLAGWKSIYVPWAIAIHLESFTRAKDNNCGVPEEYTYFKTKWNMILKDVKMSAEIKEDEKNGI